MNVRNLTLAVLVLATPIFASTIDNISFTPAADSPFASSLTESFTSTQALLAGTVSCDSASPCTGEVGQYFIGLDLTGPLDTPVSISISGNLSGDTAGSGDLIIASIPEPFVIPSGTFDENIFSHELAPGGLVDVNYTLNVTLPANETVTLPITFTVGAVPEPVGESMLVVGLLGLIGLIRYRATR